MPKQSWPTFLKYSMSILHFTKLKTMNIKRGGDYKALAFTFKPSEVGEYQDSLVIIWKMVMKS